MYSDLLTSSFITLKCDQNVNPLAGYPLEFHFVPTLKDLIRKC